MAKGGADSQQGGADNSLEFLWLVLGAIIALLLAWHFGNAYITQFVCYIRYYEIVAIKYTLSLWINLGIQIPNVHLPMPNLTALNTWQKYSSIKHGAVPFIQIIRLSQTVGSYLRYPIMLILLSLAGYLTWESPLQRFKNVFTIKKLRLLEQENWPQITPVVKLDLINADLNSGPWAMAMSPLQFCKKNNLLNLTKTTEGRYNMSLIRGATYRLFALQIGARWKNPESLPMYLQALYAVFVARINGDKKSADKLIDQLAISSASGKLDFSGVKEIIAKHAKSKAVQNVIRIHAYVTTVMASLLNSAREAGVLASSEFIWLKPMDRTMWYMLNSAGRPTAVTEIAGAFAHWLAEKKMGLPLIVPMVDEAVNGLEIVLKDIIYKPDEE